MEYIVPHGAEEPSIGIEYWVVLNYRKQQDRSILRGSSNELYVQPNHPTVATMNGQSQGEMTGQILKEIGLGMVSRHIVIHRADQQITRHPPALPATKASTMTPNRSSLLFTPDAAPLTANTNVPITSSVRTSIAVLMRASG